MSVLFIVLPLALASVLVAVVAFVWAARRGQFDDLSTPAIRVVLDDSPDELPPSARSDQGLRSAESSGIMPDDSA